MRRSFPLVFLLLFCAPVPQSDAFQPLQVPVHLIAGDGGSAYLDGDFDQACFGEINGLLWDEENNQLLVADGKNHAIRVVDFDRACQVRTLIKLKAPGEPDLMEWGSTHQVVFFTTRQQPILWQLDLSTRAVTLVAGSDQAGFRDGAGRDAAFSQITGLTYWPEQKVLLLADLDNHAIRTIDIETHQVKTLSQSGDLNGIRWVGLDRQTQLIYFIDGRSVINQLQWDHPAIDPVVPSSGQAVQIVPGDVTIRKWFDCPTPLVTAMLRPPYLYLSLEAPPLNRTFSPLARIILNDSRSLEELDYNDIFPQWVKSSPDRIRTLPAGTTETAFQQYRLFHLARALEFRPRAETLLVADDKNQRILALECAPEANLSTSAPRSTTPTTEVINVMIYGSSLLGSTSDSPDADFRKYSLCKVTEYWLNLLADLQDRKEQFKTFYIVKGNNLFHSRLSDAKDTIPQLREKDIDLVIINLNYWDLLNEAFSYINKPLVNGKLGTSPDPEFLVTPLSKRELHPEGTKLLRYVQTHPKEIGMFAEVSKDMLSLNVANIFEALDCQANRDVIMPLVYQQILDYRERLDLYNRTAKKKVDLLINLIPVSANFSSTEISGVSLEGTKVIPNFLSDQLGAWCRANHIPFQDTIAPSKFIEPSIFPLFVTPGNHHYSMRAVELISFLTAYNLLKNRPGQP